MTEVNATEWRNAIQSEKTFEDYIRKYFEANQELVGNYETPGYYEYYTVTLDSKEGLVVTLKTGLNQQANAAALPFKDVEHLSIEEFRQLILNKKFEDKTETLTDVFTNIMATDPTARFNKKGRK
ncbi:MAG: hypothetical protein LKF37_10265 [Lentilactobacillus diolivorans]|jgi:hypothetical protein|nr:hypothetical protein [Lentilactobacillus diolivorans]